MTLSNRRDFLKNMTFFAVGLNALSLSAAPPSFFGEKNPLAKRIPILQGATNFTTTQFNVMWDKNLKFSILTADGKETQALIKTQIVKKSFSAWRAHRLFVENLAPGIRYQLVVSAQDGTVLDRRIFQCLKENLTKPRLALASCMRDTLPKAQGAMWAALAATKPDLLFLLGDNVYVDDGPTREEPVSEKKIWRRYVETRKALDLYHMPELIPTLAIWDDHDFGKDDTYGSTPWVKVSADIFRTLYPQDALIPEMLHGPGISSYFEAYDQRFFLMDDRSFRSAPKADGTHWGSKQEEWLFHHLSTNHAPAWLFNGSQFFAGFRTGWSYERNQPTSLKQVMSRLKDIQAPVIFGSGDVHYSEVMKIEADLMGYESYEITSSSIHSNARAPMAGNTRRMVSTGEHNFIITDVAVRTNGLDLAVKSIGSKSKELFALNELSINR